MRKYYELFRIGWILMREGVTAYFPSDQLPPIVSLCNRVVSFVLRRRIIKYQRSDRLARAMARLGPSYVKMGQFLATRPDIVGEKLSEDLGLLQDKMDFFPTRTAKFFVSASLKSPIEELYHEFNDPIAAASIAQVHPAIVDDINGCRKVAVKIIRPGIRQRFFRDIQTMYLVARIQERLIPSMKRLRFSAIVATLEQVTKMEMDLRLEAAAFSEMAENIAQDYGFRVPKVDWNRTGRDVITMEWIDGIKISDTEKLRTSGHDLERLSVTLMQSFLLHTLRDGFFHADLHPGNLFVDSKGCIVAVDMGITGRLGKRERRFLAEILYGFISRDYQRVADVHFEAGYVPPHHSPASFAQAIRAIGEPIHGQSSDIISMGKLLTMLFEITELFDMMTRSELLMLQKTMVVVEGVARMLNPEFNMWVSSEPIVKEWIRDHIGPKSHIVDFQDGIKNAVRLVQGVPHLSAPIEKIFKALIEASEKDNFLNFSKTESPRSIYEYVGKLALLSVIIILFYIISVMR
ncbi:2-polyprenylphenol 6-hydroxylase [Candidatus Liberibacter solanacearum]|uniref:2-polyprenylphenol 6-hydroxylase n=2 Tax=Candidatus Liberibacter solanacearum TaxID=556287 RepID=A0A1V2N8L0_9HYPH|nr:2-polyprenylphenol 6-hydroxylase [Candidatus Liberibacter solanacearum]ONI59775.1 ubiquinone biosynthesis protein UbiB [Candidatus Liberibacter solanacearum]ONI60004.1 2-polyprenylphenol 6-hydroxylase [Candidatus Liberibacter solanacearum]